MISRWSSRFKKSPVKKNEPGSESRFSVSRISAAPSPKCPPVKTSASSFRSREPRITAPKAVSCTGVSAGFVILFSPIEARRRKNGRLIAAPLAAVSLDANGHDSDPSADHLPRRIPTVAAEPPNGFPSEAFLRANVRDQDPGNDVAEHRTQMAQVLPPTVTSSPARLRR